MDHVDRLSASCLAPSIGAAEHKRLLTMSVDWFWALDAGLRLVELDGTRAREGFARARQLLGSSPWAWPGVRVADAEHLRLALIGRRPVDGLEFTLRDHRGQVLCLALWGEPRADSDGTFAGYMGTARDVTLRRRSEALLVLEHTVTRHLAEASTSRKVLQAVMRVICETEQWETAGYFRVEDEQGTTRLIAGWSGPGMAQAAADYYKQTTDQLVPPGGFLSQVVATAQPRWVRALRESQTTWAERVRSTGERSTLFAPVLVDGRVIGVFAFASREHRRPDERLLRSMRVIGEQAGQFLKRKEAEVRMRVSEERFRALTALSSDWYWETDAQLCLVRIDGQRAEEGELFPGKGAIGKRLALDDLVPTVPKQDAASYRGFRDAAFTTQGVDGARRFFSISAEPMFDQRGGFLGYRGVGRDVSAIKRAEELRVESVRLEAENQALQEGNRLKGLFLANMSHELRTPLNAIGGFTYLLRRGVAEADSSKTDGYLAKIEDANRQLLQMIEQLLDFAKAEGGKIDFHHEPVQLSTLVAGVLATSAALVKQKQLEVAFDFDASVDAVVVDPLRLKQVLWTYLSNAVKFTSEHGIIVVRSQPVGDTRFRVEVQDTGIGIAQSELPKLFTSSGQLSTGLAKSHQGAGYGLALARLLVEAQGGTVGVRSVIGVGSTFHLELPRFAHQRAV